MDDSSVDCTVEIPRMCDGRYRLGPLTFPSLPPEEHYQRQDPSQEYSSSHCHPYYDFQTPVLAAFCGPRDVTGSDGFRSCSSEAWRGRSGAWDEIEEVNMELSWQA